MLSVFEQELEMLKRGEGPNFWFPPPASVLDKIEKGRTAEALEQMIALQAQGPTNASKVYSLLSLAEFYEYVLLDQQKAIDCHKKALKEYPRDGLPARISQAPFTVGVWSSIKIAICLQKMERYEEAVEYYSCHYPWRMFWFEIAECHALAGNKTKAKEAYRKAGEYHLGGHWGSEIELAFRAYAVLDDVKMMRKAVDAVPTTYVPALAATVLTQLKEWAEGAGMENAAAIVASVQKNSSKIDTKVTDKL
jgi:tetratricopeptide (TPR) repeat protein